MRRVLAVDDQKTMLREWNRQVRGSRGIELHTAANPDEASELFESIVFDVVILDVLLRASITGIDLARKFRQSRPSVLIATVSVDMDVELAQASTLAGSDLFFAKPITVAAVISDLVRARRSREPSLATRTRGQRMWDSIHQAVADCNGDRTAAARSVGLTRQAVQYWLRRPRPS